MKFATKKLRIFGSVIFVSAISSVSVDVFKLALLRTFLRTDHGVQFGTPFRADLRKPIQFSHDQIPSSCYAYFEREISRKCPVVQRQNGPVLSLAVAQCLSFSGLALAQCGPSDHVYIDPRLVIQRPHYTREQVTASMNIEALSAEAKAKILSQYREQDQPIQMPMGNGYVLISPLNPCVQQFIPLR
jgi:hypothetical protein